MNKEKILLLVLALIQFINIVDFMIMMPLGPQLMRIFDLSPKEFGYIVSSYTFSAGFFGFLGVFIIDKFDRKSVLMVAFAGFTIGTFACGIAGSFLAFLLARIVTGLFGGMLGALVYAIIGDVIPYERRGSAMGIVMAAFSLASVLGVPMGLLLANAYTWHTPFFFLGGLGVLVWMMIYFFIPNLKGHIVNRSLQNAPNPTWIFLKELMSNQNQLKALAMMCLLVFGQFTVIPFISPYMVANVGFSEHDLTYIYLVGGAVTIFTSPLIGKLSDIWSKHRVFTIFAFLNLIPIWLITNLEVTPMAIVLCISASFFICTTGRMVPAMALITSTVSPQQRGSFMTISASVQQLSSGFASLLSSYIVTKNTQGLLVGYEYVGYIAIVAGIVSVWMAQKVRAI